MLAAFLASPTPVPGKINGVTLAGSQVQEQLQSLGPVKVVGHLARSATDLSVTWKTPQGVVGATRFTLDVKGNIEAVAVRWEDL